MMLMLVLVGMMGTALLFDLRGDRLEVSRYTVCGMLLLLAAVVMQMVDAAPQVQLSLKLWSMNIDSGGSLSFL